MSSLPRVLRLALGLALSACAASNGAGEPAPPDGLTEAERAAGWRLLFDGRTTAGWRGYRMSECPSGWQVVEGALTRVDEAGDIVTQEEFQDFVLDFEWRVAPGGNSGLMFHVTEDHEYPWETGPEYQLLDDAGHADGKEPLTSAGSNYAMHAPAKRVTRPAGEWNDSRLEVRGTHVVHWLNGERVVEYDLWNDDWKRRVSGSKWKDRPDYGLRKSGRIALQDHGDRVSFRALKIRVIGDR